MMPLNLQTTLSIEDLCTALERVDISVPGRTEGRTTHHTETWTICHLLSTLAHAKRLSYPLSVCHRDKPDFLIDVGLIKVGVEVTEAIPQSFAAYCALGEREAPDTFLEPAHFGWDGPTMSTNEIRTLLHQGRLTSDGWVGDQPEREWARSIQSVVDTKLAKLARPDFVKFDQNWLSIYDNLPLSNVHLEEANSFLWPLLQDRWSCNPAFDVLFIEHGSIIIRITVNGSEQLVLNDLWG